MLNEELLRQLIFLDTETTGRETHDRIFQVAYAFEGEEVSELFKPPVPLCVEAMEATHYTNRDVTDKMPFDGSELWRKLHAILAREEVVFVAHNAPFDIEMLRRDGLEVVRTIDTLKVARHLDPDAKLGAYRLQYLRYALDLQVADAAAHDALGDVRVLKVLFVRLFAKMLAQGESPEQVIEEMITISSRPSMIRKITFGKHNGKLLTELAHEDPGYLEWLLKQKEADTENSHDQNEDWIYSLKEVLGRSGTS